MRWGEEGIAGGTERGRYDGRQMAGDGGERQRERGHRKQVENSDSTVTINHSIDDPILLNFY